MGFIGVCVWRKKYKTYDKIQKNNLALNISLLRFNQLHLNLDKGNG